MESAKVSHLPNGILSLILIFYLIVVNFLNMYIPNHKVINFVVSPIHLIMKQQFQILCNKYYMLHEPQFKALVF